MRVKLTTVDDRYSYFEVRVPHKQLQTTEVVKLTDIAAVLLYYPLARLKDRSLYGKQD